MKKILLFVLILAVLACAVAFFWGYKDLHRSVAHTKSSEYIEIARGSNPSTVVKKLAVEGVIKDLRSPIFHDDRKPLRRWFNSQARYTELEAQKLRAADYGQLTLPDRLRRWRVLAPPAMLVYCLFVRRGILDGWAGFYYAFQRAVAELMLSHRLRG